MSDLSGWPTFATGDRVEVRFPHQYADLADAVGTVVGASQAGEVRVRLDAPPVGWVAVVTFDALELLPARGER
jgi:hypothetical protein